MKKYKVIPLSVGGLGNKIHRAGDTVSEHNFPPGTIDKLVKDKYLEEIPEAEEIKVTAEVIDPIVPPAKTENEPELPGEELTATGDEDKKPLPGEELTATGDVDKKPEVGSFSKAKSFVNSKGESKVVTNIEQITKAELAKELTDHEVPFEGNAKKEVLYDLWMSL